MRTREAQIEDAGPMASLLRGMGYSVEASAVAARLRATVASGGRVWLGVLGDRCVGLAHVEPRISLGRGAFAELLALVVGEADRRQGVGRELVAHVENWARSQGLEAMRVRCNIVREQAHAFYESVGYATLKDQRNFQRDLTD